MCGRYASARRDDELAHRFHVSELVGDELGPSWNVAPTQDVRGVLERVEADHPVRQLRTLRWGLVPSWAKDSKIGSRMINARVETITEKPAFRRAAANRRLIVPMDGYYEWQAPESGKGRKTPYYLTDPDGAPLAAAGLYELWRDPSKGDDDPGRWLWTLTVITTNATDTLGHIHDRSPLLLRTTCGTPGSTPTSPTPATSTRSCAVCLSRTCNPSRSPRPWGTRATTRPPSSNPSPDTGAERARTAWPFHGGLDTNGEGYPWQ